jgi:hypothetical protein
MQHLKKQYFSDGYATQNNRSNFSNLYHHTQRTSVNKIIWISMTLLIWQRSVCDRLGGTLEETYHLK